MNNISVPNAGIAIAAAVLETLLPPKIFEGGATLVTVGASATATPTPTPTATATPVSVPASVSVVEGSDAEVTISVGSAFGSSVTFDVSVSDGSASGAADPLDGDFDDDAVTEVVFGSGDTSKTISIPTTGDDLDEGDETFTVSVAVADDSELPSGFALGNASTTVTITDDDSSPVLPSLSAVSVRVGQVVSVDATATDADGDTVTYVWTRDGSETSPALPDDTDLDVATLSFTAGAVGTYTMTVTASDGNGNSDTATVVITVAAPFRVTIQYAKYSVTEGNNVSMLIAARSWWATIPSPMVFTVSYTDGTASGAAVPADGDFDNDAVTEVTVPAGVLSSATVTVPITDDDLDEEAETFTVTIAPKTSLPAGWGMDISSATVTINDDDSSPVLAALGAVSAKVGQEVNVIASAADADGDTVSYSWARKVGESAPALPEGVELGDARLRFTPSEAGVYTMIVTASDGNGNSDTATVVITVAGKIPVAIPTAVAVTEGSNASVTISVAEAFGRRVRFNVSYVDGTATGDANPADGDFDNDAATRVTFGAGHTSRTFSVPITDDDLDEAAESFTVRIAPVGSLPSGFTLGNSSATVTITDDDSSPVLADLEDVLAKVGEPVDVRARATDADGDTVSYAWARDSGESVPALPDGTRLNRARLRFTPTEAGTYTMTVTASDGNGNSASETVVITVAAATVVSVPTAVAVTEGSDATVTITTAAAFGEAVSFTVSYADGTATGAAVPSDGDFDDDAVTTVSFGAADTSKSFTVPVTDDDLDELAESFTVSVAVDEDSELPDGFVLGNTSATVTITDDDESPVLPSLSAVSAKVGESVSVDATATDADGDTVAYAWVRDSGETSPALPDGTDLDVATLSFTAVAAGTYTMTVTASDGNGNSDTATVVITVTTATPVSIPSKVAVTEGGDASVTITTGEAFGEAVSFTVSYTNGTATGATNPSEGDFDNDAVTTVAFGAAETSKSFTVPVTDDDLDEEAETFTVTVSATLPSGFVLGNASSTVTITDDDASPVLADLEDVSVKAGQAVSVTASATDADGDTVTYAWVRKSGESSPALPESTDLGVAELGFTPTSAGTYTMTVTASDGNGNSDTATVVVTVAAASVVAIPTAVAVTEGSDGSVTITTAAAFGEVVSFTVSYTDGTATGATNPSEGDFDNDAVTTVSFGAGDTSKSFTVPITDDDLDEASESFTVAIASAALPAGFVLGNSSATVTITDDDESPVLPSLSAVSVKAGQEVTIDATATDADGDTIAYTWVRKASESAPALPDGTALGAARLQFTPAAAGTYTMTVTASDGNGNSDTATVVITVAAKTVVSVPTAVAVTEGTDTAATVTITAAEAFGEAVSFDVSYTDVSAGGAGDPADGDFDNDAVTTVAFSAADTSKSFTVPISDDDLDEAAESFTVTVASSRVLPAGFTLGNASTTVTITDDDASPVLADLDAVSVKVGQAVSVTASATDADGDTVSYAWARKVGETVPALPAGTALGSAGLGFTPTTAGTYTMIVTASDGNENTDTETVVVTVNPATVVSIPAATTVAEGSDATVTITTGEAFGEAVTFTVSYTAGTATGAGNPTNADYDNDAVTTVAFGAADTSKTITIPITDDDLDEPSESFTVVVASTGLPAGWVLGNASSAVTIGDDDESPVLADLGDVVVKVGQTVDVTASATDADGDTVSYQWARKVGETVPALPAGTTLNSAGLSFVAATTGTYTMVVTASDGNGNTDTATVVVTVNPATVVSVPAAVAVTEGTDETATVTITTAEAFGAAVTFTVSYTDGTATGAGDSTNADYDNDAVATVAFAAADTSRTIVVPVTDDDEMEGAETFTVTIAPTAPLPAGWVLGNAAATVTIGNDDRTVLVTVKVGQEVNVVESPADGDGGTLSWAWVREQGETTPPLPEDTVLNQARLRFTPTTVGVYTMVVTATNPGGETSSRATVIITVVADTPVTVPATVAVTEGADTAAVVTIEVGDPFNEEVRFNVAYTDTTAGGTADPAAAVGGGDPGESDPGTVTGAGDYDNDEVVEVVFDPGVISRAVAIPVFDDDVDEGSESFVVRVSPVGELPDGFTMGNASSTVTIVDDDHSPVLKPLPDVRVKAGQEVDVTASAADGDGDPVTYAWARRDGEVTPPLPEDTVLNQARLRFTPTEVGTYTMTVTASDDHGNTGTATVVVAVVSTLRFGADDTSVDISVPIPDDDLYEDVETITVVIEPASTLPDGFVLGNATATVTVLDDDHPPELEPIGDVRVRPGQEVDVTAVATDGDDEDAITYTWARADDETDPALPRATVLNRARLRFTPTGTGTYTMTVTASDGNENTDSRTIVITVAHDDTPTTTSGGTGATTNDDDDGTNGDAGDGDTSTNDNAGNDDTGGDEGHEEEDAAPVLFPINDMTIEVGQRADVTASAFDPEGATVTYAWARADDETEPALPDDTTLDTARLAFTPTEAGTYTMTVTATDAAGNTTARTVVITVVTDSVVSVPDAVTVTEGTDATATVTITIPEPFGETVAFTIRYAHTYNTE